MEKDKLFRFYFWTVGIYDVMLGAAFILFYRNIYGYFNIPLANHPGYIYLPALFIVAGGIGEFLIARNPLRNVDLVIVRLLMKLAFVVIVFSYHFRYGVPLIFVLIAILSVVGVVKNLFFIRWARSVNGNS